MQQKKKNQNIAIFSCFTVPREKKNMFYYKNNLYIYIYIDGNLNLYLSLLELV